MNVPSSTEKNVYTVGCETEEDWIYIRDALLDENWLDDEEIPTEACECVSDKKVGHTRGIFMLTDAEAEQLKQHPKVEYAHHDSSYYQDYYRPPLEERYFGLDYGQKYQWRWENRVLIERANQSQSNFYPDHKTPRQINKAGWELARPAAKRDIWHYLKEANGLSGDVTAYSISARLARTTTGEDVDMIACDTGTWCSHPEFINNLPGVEYPRNYKGGNALDPNGGSAVLDLFLHGPYYIDPEWFDADPADRLTVRWDGTVIPIRYWAQKWWSDSDSRSPQFNNVDEVSIGYSYYEQWSIGDLYGNGGASSHGTSVASQMYGRTHGWAYNANKWAIRTDITSFDDMFDAITIFHQNKPVNPKHGNRNPTICNHSWGYVNPEMGGGYQYRSGHHWFRPSSATVTTTATEWSIAPSPTSWYTAVQPNHSQNAKEQWFRYLGYYGYGSTFPCELLSHGDLTASTNCFNSGVIHVVAPGNSNQKMVFSDHEDYNNHFAPNRDDATRSFNSNTLTLSGKTYYRSTNRIGYPGQSGRYYDEGKYKYKALIVGALSDMWGTDNGVYKEFKVDYSNMGEVVDCYCAAHDTQAATNKEFGDNSSWRRADNEAFYELYNVGAASTYTSSSYISGFKAYTDTATNRGGDPNANKYWGLSSPNDWPDVLGQGRQNHGSSRVVVGPNSCGRGLGRPETILFKSNTGHRFATGGSLNYPTVTYTGIAATFRGRVGIQTTEPEPATNYSTLADWRCYRCDLPFTFDYCGVTTNRVGISPWGVLEIGGEGSHSKTSTEVSWIHHGGVPKWGQIALNHGHVSPYVGIRTEVLGVAPNRQFWVRYESKDGSGHTSGDMDTVWEAVFTENSGVVDFHVETNTHIGETTQTVDNDYFHDDWFSGTSSAAPIACGIVGTKLEVNRTWDYADVKNWVTTKVGISSSDEFYYGDEAPSGTNARNDISWGTVTSLHGGSPIILWNAPTDNDPPIENQLQIDIGSNLTIEGGTNNLNIKYEQ